MGTHKDLPVSPLATPFPEMPVVPGVRLATVEAALRYTGRTDLLLAELSPGSTAAGVLTRSLTAAAPVTWCQAALTAGEAARGLVVTAGNANAFTGRAGEASVAATAAATAERLGCSEKAVYVASTGVIGEPLAPSKVVAGIDKALPGLKADNWRAAAEAIRTTDTFAKGASERTTIAGTEVTICGIAKGSGMIAPDMATMLAFVFTDAKLPQPVLQKLLKAGADRSFNATTVDGDTSTSDTLLLFATGQADHPNVSGLRPRALAPFRRALDKVLLSLAHQVVRDGEGATKFVSVTVEGAASARAARRIGLAIGNSPLVKTAIAGEDANWGRIVMAVGKAGERADRDRLRIWIGGVLVASEGHRVEDYDEAPVTAHMRGQEIDIRVDVGVGRGKATIWTCDLTHGYISINGDYRS